LRSYHPKLIKENLNKKQIIYLEENKTNMPFLNVIEYSGRVYPFGESASHILGYIGIINPGEYKANKDKGYRRDSIIGKTGIEREYDELLRGVEGENIKIVNSLGKPVRNLSERTIPAVPGKNVVLSIDARLQDLAYNILYGKRGVIIVTHPHTGEVLALASSPGFDANLFINPDTREEVFKRLISNPHKPFLNRAIQGRYPPGSIFKIVTAMAALEDEKITPTEKVDCRKGYFELGDRIFRDWKTHGVEDIFSAMENSVNVYFYKLGYQLGYASILEHSRKFGLSERTGLDIPGEISGFIPTPEWKEKRFKEPWYDGNTVNAAIGQGFTLLTPMGANNIVSLISAGKIFKPRILWKVKNPYTGIVEKEFSAQQLTNFKPSPENIRVIGEGLERVPLTGTGTYHKHLSKVPIAGKTGSAQNSRGKTHSWFVSYGPVNKSGAEQYAMTVMVETMGHGGTIAVPVSSVLYNFLEGDMSREQALKTIYQIFRYQESKN
jgi:penicillin-binding protein 2